MTKRKPLLPRLFLALASLFALGLPGRAESELDQLYCAGWHAHLAPMDSSANRKYAPDRMVDILHLAIDVTPDFVKRTVAAKVTLKFKPIAKPLAELKLDGVDLLVSNATGTEAIAAYQATREHVILTFATPIPADKETSVTITYTCEPRQGFYFRTEAMGYPKGDDHVFTQGEANEARHWYPCFDEPNEKFTSEVTAHIPEGMIALSNGRKLSEAKDAATGLVAVRWLQDKPHVNYLVTLCAGYFKKVEDKHRDIPMAFYTTPSEFPQAANSFRDTKNAMTFFEEEIGVPYPWAKYDQVCVHDFVAGGMENTSQTTLTMNTLFADETENINDSRGLVAHELAHQWFGDLVTTKDWSHLWLNEGFATYYDALHDGHMYGPDQLKYHMRNNARSFLDTPNDVIPIVYRKFDTAMEQFGFRAYPKGSWILHMLRGQLGADLYRKCIKTYLERHQYGNVVTDDLKKVVEELSGRSFDQFFDQWVYHAHHPELEVNYSWDARAKLAKLSIKQNQKLSDDVLLFNFPLQVRFKTKETTTDREITVKEKAEDFYFPLAEAPEIVRVDPEGIVLAKVAFTLPNAMLYAQLADQGDVLGRLLAVEQIGARKEKEGLAKLKQALNSDPFYGVRLEASKALRAIHSPEAREILLASATQSDARVRRQVVDDLGSFYHEDSYAAARKVLGQEKNPAVAVEALRDIAGYNRPEVREVLLKNLDAKSYKNSLATAAINGMRSQDDPSYIAPLREALVRRAADFRTGGLSAGLGALAYLARNDTNRDEVREFLIGYVNDPRQRIADAAINALGTLGDPKAAPVLEKFAAGKDAPERAAAERALAAVRAARKPVDDFKNLRTEVMDLQKTNRDLRRDLDELKKKLEALTPATESAKKPKDTLNRVKK